MSVRGRKGYYSYSINLIKAQCFKIGENLRVVALVDNMVEYQVIEYSNEWPVVIAIGEKEEMESVYKGRIKVCS